MNTRLFGTSIGIVVVAAALAVLPQLSDAAGSTRYVATTGSDNGPNDCLTEASPCATIGHAHDQATGGDTIEVAAGTYQDATIAITKDVTISGQGTGSTILDGATDKIVITTNTAGTRTIQNLTIQNGFSGSVGGGIDDVGDTGTTQLTNVELKSNTGNGGGAINIGNSNVTVTNSSIHNNTASSSGGGGIYGTGGTITVTGSDIYSNTANGATFAGGIFNFGGTLNISDSQVRQNLAQTGGGLFTGNGGSMTITNTLVKKNTATSSGGGAYTDGSTALIQSSLFQENNVSGSSGGAYHHNSSGTTTIENSTFSANEQGTLSASATMVLNNVTIYGTTGGNYGIDASGGTWTVRNSIVAGSTGGAGTCTGSIGTMANNIEDENTCGFAVNNTDPQLQALADNGGGTMTHALPSTSPAVGTGDNGTCETVDQRGASRPAGTTCDKGAFELHSLGTTTTTLSGFHGDSVGSVQVANVIHPASPSASLKFAGCGTSIPMTYSAPNWSPTAPTTIPTCATGGTTPASLIMDYATNLSVPVQVSAQPVIGGVGPTVANPLIGVYGLGLPSFSVTGSNIPDGSQGTFIPQGCSSAEGIPGTFSGGAFVPTSPAIAPSCATAGATTATLITGSFEPSSGLQSAALTAQVNVPTDIQNANGGTASQITGTVGGDLPQIPTTGGNIPNGTGATFTPEGCTTGIAGTIQNGVFVPTAGAQIPSCALSGQRTGVLQITNGPSINVSTNFASSGLAQTGTSIAILALVLALSTTGVVVVKRRLAALETTKE